MEASRAWQPILNLQLPVAGPEQPRPVLDVAWAPNVGRRFHYIASAEGEQVKVYKLLRDGNTMDGDGKKETSAILTLSPSGVEILHANAWRCQWNVTGTVLALSGDGGVVQLWKADSDGQFQCVSTVQSAVAPS